MARLKIIIGSYGFKWVGWHGASGGVTLRPEHVAQFVEYARRFKPLLPGYESPSRCGLWPGKPYRVVDVEQQGDDERGWIIAECEPVF